MTEKNQDPERANPPSPAPVESGDPAERASEKLSLRQMIGSAIAAAIGVQSSENRRRDFSRGRAGPFIAIGIVGTTLFVLAMVLLVRLVLSLAAG